MPFLVNDVTNGTLYQNLLNTSAFLEDWAALSALYNASMSEFAMPAAAAAKQCFDDFEMDVEKSVTSTPANAMVIFHAQNGVHHMAQVYNVKDEGDQIVIKMELVTGNVTMLPEGRCHKYQDLSLPHFHHASTCTELDANWFVYLDRLGNTTGLTLFIKLIKDTAETGGNSTTVAEADAESANLEPSEPSPSPSSPLPDLSTEMPQDVGVLSDPPLREGELRYKITPGSPMLEGQSLYRGVCELRYQQSDRNIVLFKNGNLGNGVSQYNSLYNAHEVTLARETHRLSRSIFGFSNNPYGNLMLEGYYCEDSAICCRQNYDCCAEKNCYLMKRWTTKTKLYKNGQKVPTGATLYAELQDDCNFVIYMQEPAKPREVLWAWNRIVDGYSLDDTNDCVHSCSEL